MLCLSLIDTPQDVRLSEESVGELLVRCNMNRLAAKTNRSNPEPRLTWSEIYGRIDKDYVHEQLKASGVDLWLEIGKHPVGWVEHAGKRAAVSANSNVEATVRAIIFGSAISDRPLARYGLTDERLRYLFRDEIAR